MTYMEEERIKKVLVWRATSFILTLILTWAYTGSVKEASFFTLLLHACTLCVHYVFEAWWERNK